jgi:hypothetical protein
MPEKMDADQEERKAEMRAWREKLHTKTKAIQVEMEAIRVRTKAMREKRMEANCNTCQKETMACQEMTKANQEVSKEEATVRSLKIMKKQHRKPKKLTQGDCGSWGMLVATCRKVSRHAAVAWHKRGIVRKNWIRAKVT